MVPARVVKVVVAVKEKRGGRKYTMTGSRKRRRKGEKASAGMEEEDSSFYSFLAEACLLHCSFLVSS